MAKVARIILFLDKCPHAPGNYGTKDRNHRSYKKISILQKSSTYTTDYNANDYRDPVSAHSDINSSGQN